MALFTPEFIASFDAASPFANFPTATTATITTNGRHGYGAHFVKIGDVPVVGGSPPSSDLVAHNVGGGFFYHDAGGFGPSGLRMEAWGVVSGVPHLFGSIDCSILSDGRMYALFTHPLGAAQEFPLDSAGRFLLIPFSRYVFLEFFVALSIVFSRPDLLTSWTVSVTGVTGINVNGEPQGSGGSGLTETWNAAVAVSGPGSPPDGGSTDLIRVINLGTMTFTGNIVGQGYELDDVYQNPAFDLVGDPIAFFGDGKADPTDTLVDGWFVDDAAAQPEVTQEFIEYLIEAKDAGVVPIESQTLIEFLLEQTSDPIETQAIIEVIFEIAKVLNSPQFMKRFTSFGA